MHVHFYGEPIDSITHERERAMTTDEKPGEFLAVCYCHRRKGSPVYRIRLVDANGEWINRKNISLRQQWGEFSSETEASRELLRLADEMGLPRRFTVYTHRAGDGELV